MRASGNDWFFGMILNYSTETLEKLHALPGSTVVYSTAKNNISLDNVDHSQKQRYCSLLRV